MGAWKDLPENSLYEEAIRNKVCTHCIDYGEDGQCHSHDPNGCAIYRFMPELVSIAESMDSPSEAPYIRAVRKRICTNCLNQNDSYRCELRDAVDCSLDRYLPMVVDAIREVRMEA